MICRYAIDASKLENELNWRATETFESGLAKTVRWYCENREWWQLILSQGYQPVRDWARMTTLRLTPHSR